MDKLEKLLKFVTAEEKKYYELAFKNLREINDLMANKSMVAQASAFQRVRYAIEDLMNGE